MYTFRSHRNPRFSSFNLLIGIVLPGVMACGSADDAPSVASVEQPISTTRNPSADTYVRDGSNANTNFGSSTVLEVKRSSSGFNREAYLRFGLTSITGSVQRATLRVFGTGTSTESVPIVAQLLPDNSFTEASVTYNTKPVSTPIELGRVKVNSTTPGWFEFDVTGVVRQKKRSGGANIEFKLKSTTNTSSLVSFNSNQATSNRPELVVTTADALFVVGNTTLGSGDAAVKTRLEQLGYAVTVKSGPAATTADATGKSLVLVSSTVASADVNTKFRDVTVPVVTWESAIYDDMKLTGTVSGTDFGTTGSQTIAKISNRSHALAGGREGSVTVGSSSTHSWGKPASSALQIATLNSDTTKFNVFGYEKGASMVGMTAPARRVALFFTDTTPTSLSRSGWALFDGAVNFASASKPFTVKKVLVINYDPILESQGGQRVSEFFGRPGGARQVAEQFVTDMAQASGDYLQYQIANVIDLDEWPQAVDGTKYTDSEFLADWITNEEHPNQTLRNNPVDYAELVSRFALDSGVSAGTIDEIFVAAPPGNGFAEERMIGPNGYWVNSDPLFTSASRNYFIHYIDTSRPVELFEHGYLHRFENILRHVYGKKYGADGIFTLGASNWNTTPYDRACSWATASSTCATPRRHFWDSFTLVDGVAQNLRARGDTAAVAGPGTVHFVPNAQRMDLDNYNYGQPWVNRPLASVKSNADDWMYNYPNLTGETRQVEMREWPYIGLEDNWQYGFMLWFTNHVPRVPGRHSDGLLHNWWEYTVNFNDYPEALP